MRHCLVALVCLAIGCSGPADEDTLVPDTLDDGPEAPSADDPTTADQAIATDIDDTEPADLVAQLSAAQTVSYGLILGPDFSKESNRQAYYPWLAKLRVKRIRMWFGVVKWTASNGSPDWYADRVKLAKERIDSYASRGYKITLTISGGDCRTQTCPGLPSKSAAQAYFTKVRNDLGASLDKVDALEVWNEWDHVYGNFTAKDYVDRILSASAVFKQGHTKLAILAGSVITGKEGDIGKLVAAGASDYADGFVYHPYVNQGSDMKARLATVRKLVPANKSLHLTEWGCRTTDTNARAKCIGDSLQAFGINGVKEADYYIVLSTSNAATQKTFGLLEGRQSGSALVIDRARQPLFDAFKNAIP